MAVWYSARPISVRYSAASRVAAHPTEEKAMKADIHPQYEEVTATCSCGNVIKTRSTLCKPLSLDVCSECHPFYTGKQKVLDTGGRIDRFKQRFGVFGSK
jgi:large subunit ribosomal protein L31